MKSNDAGFSVSGGRWSSKSSRISLSLASKHLQSFRHKSWVDWPVLLVVGACTKNAMVSSFNRLFRLWNVYAQTTDKNITNCSASVLVLQFSILFLSVSFRNDNIILKHLSLHSHYLQGAIANGYCGERNVFKLKIFAARRMLSQVPPKGTWMATTYLASQIFQRPKV